MQSRRFSTGAILGVVVAVVMFVLVPLLTWAARVWTDYLWYVDLRQADVFVTRIISKVALGSLFAVLAFILLFVNMRIARRFAPRTMLSAVPDAVSPQVRIVIDQLRSGAKGIMDKLILFGALGFAFLNGLAMSEQWETFRLWMGRVPFGVKDPTFGVDVGLWVFTLPAAESLLAWGTDILILTLVLSSVVHFLSGAIQPWARLKGFAPHVKAHLSVVAALLVLTRAFGYWIDIYNLNLSPRGQVTGASYTDIAAQLPALRILIIISLVTAALLLLNIRYRGWRLPTIALGTWIAAAVLLGGLWPAAVQQFIVTPNEASREAPYIEHNIEMTRKAFGLSDIKGARFKADESLTATDVVENQTTLSNVRLWDPEIVKQSFQQLQTIRPYYEFPEVDVDRYMVNGQMRQVLVSAREMNSSLLAETAQTWVNRHLVYTHGSGIVMSPSNEFDTRGLPKFIIGDVPPKVSSDVASGSPDLEITQPRIYFGEETDDYVIVGTTRPEFDYPEGDENAFYEYEHSGGAQVGSFFRRVAWALRLGSSQVLFSEYIDSSSRVLMNRDLESRLARLAPWLVLEDDPYPVLADGKIVWVVDAYTASSRFPYAQRLDDGTNYLRNSVKITIDAFTGDVTFYAFDPDDPILAAWRNVFPSLFTDVDKMPEAIQEHLRYPQGFFSAQAEVYRTYHMTNANTFYNKEDQWEIPGLRQGSTMEPFFVLLQLPGTDREHFYLMQPYTPRNRDNMIGWMAVSSDPENYGTHTVYQFPKERVIFGPEQVSARINQDSVISAQLSLWNQRGSGVLFGKMQVIPIKDSIVYIQPLFLQAEQTAIPELTRVIVAYSDKVEMESDLKTALLKVFGEQAPAEATATPGPDAGGGASSPADAALASRLYDEAIAAQKRGDWATYGAKLKELGRVLERLAAAE
jgi:uncharacterized membrane protein (UPF0182 family)